MIIARRGSCLILILMQCGRGIFNTPILMSPTFDMKWQDSFVKIPSLIKIIQIGSPIQLPLPLRPPHWAPQQVSRSLHSYSYQSRTGAGRRVELQTNVKQRKISQSRRRPLLGPAPGCKCLIVLVTRAFSFKTLF